MKKSLYREHIEPFLMEDPDDVNYGDGSSLWYIGGVSTFCLYRDIVSNKDIWLGVQYHSDALKGIVCNDPVVRSEISIMYGIQTLSDDKMNEFVRYVIKRKPRSLFSKKSNIENELKYFKHTISGIQDRGRHKFTHYSISNILHSLYRLDADYDDYVPNRDDFILAGRLFQIKNNGEKVDILSFWNGSSTIKMFRSYIEQYLKSLNLSPDKVKYQPIELDDTVMDYEEMFSNKKPAADNDYAARKSDFKAKAHAIAGELPRGWGAAAKAL